MVVLRLEVALLLIVYTANGYTRGGAVSFVLLTLSNWFLVISWLFAPYIFNPSGFDWQKTAEDFDDWTSWLLYKGGVGVKGENSWESWWEGGTGPNSPRRPNNIKRRLNPININPQRGSSGVPPTDNSHLHPNCCGLDSVTRAHDLSRRVRVRRRCVAGQPFSASQDEAGITVVGINITTQVKFSDDDLDELRQSEGRHATLIAEMCKLYRGWYMKSDGVPGIFLHDPVSFTAIVRRKASAQATL